MSQTEIQAAPEAEQRTEAGPSSTAPASHPSGVRSTLRGRSFADQVQALSPSARGATDPPRVYPTTQLDSGSAQAGVDVHGVAAQGVAGASAALPYLQRIQSSFGPHDVSGVQASLGGPAAAATRTLGATAYATGERVAFETGSPSLHTAAHEAAHVVQQRAGVSLDGGVGQAGDAYERNADAVADRVVQGRPATDLLGPAPGIGEGTAVQRQAVQMDGPRTEGPATTPATPGPETPATEAAPPEGVGLEAGTQVEVALSARIPTAVPGLSVNVSIEGSYEQGIDRGRHYVQAEGVARLSLTYDLLFLDLSVFLQGALEFKAYTEGGWREAFNLAFEDISHWVAARELADLPAKKQAVSGAYDAFEAEVRDLFASTMNDSPSERAAQVGHAESGLFSDNVLQNVVDARSSLVGTVRGIFQDMDGHINGGSVYPGAAWIEAQAQPYLAGGVSRTELVALRDALIQASLDRHRTVSSRMDAIPAIANNPNVSFEASLQVGARVGFDLTDSVGGAIEAGRGIGISDEMGDEPFDTGTHDIWFASVEMAGQVGEHPIEGQLSYQGVGSSATRPTSFGISGSAFYGFFGEEPDPNEYAGTLQSVKNRVSTAFRNARIDSRDALGAVGTALRRELRSCHAPRESHAGAHGQVKMGFDVEFGFKRSGDGGFELDEGHVRFVVVEGVEANLGVFEGSVEAGAFVGIAF